MQDFLCSCATSHHAKLKISMKVCSEHLNLDKMSFLMANHKSILPF